MKQRTTTYYRIVVLGQNKMYPSCYYVYKIQEKDLARQSVPILK